MTLFSILDEFKMKRLEVVDITHSLCFSDVNTVILSYLVCPLCGTLYDDNNDCFCFIKNVEDIIIKEHEGILYVYQIIIN